MGVAGRWRSSLDLPPNQMLQGMPRFLMPTSEAIRRMRMGCHRSIERLCWHPFPSLASRKIQGGIGALTVSLPPGRLPMMRTPAGMATIKSWRLGQCPASGAEWAGNTAILPYTLPSVHVSDVDLVMWRFIMFPSSFLDRRKTGPTETQLTNVTVHAR
jgi:hypothetical protein